MPVESELKCDRERAGAHLFDQFSVMATVTTNLLNNHFQSSYNKLHSLNSWSHTILLFFAECGVSNPETRIVGGRPTGVNRYPWIARIVYDGHYHCGASLLTEDHVLTAAHCVRRFSVLYSNIFITLATVLSTVRVRSYCSFIFNVYSKFRHIFLTIHLTSNP